MISKTKATSRSLVEYVATGKRYPVKNGLRKELVKDLKNGLIVNLTKNFAVKVVPIKTRNILLPQKHAPYWITQQYFKRSHLRVCLQKYFTIKITKNLYSHH